MPVPRSSVRTDQMPAFRNAAEKRAWLLEQLAAVEKEALLEEMTAGKNERITIRMGEGFGIRVGDAALYEGSDAVEFCTALSDVIRALPFGTAFVVEAGKGGKVLSGGVSADEGLPPEPAEATTPKR